MTLNDLHKSFVILSNPVLSLDFQDIQITRLDLEWALNNAPNEKAYLDFLNECQSTMGKQNAIRLLDVVFDSNYFSYEGLTQFFSLKFKYQQSAMGIATLGVVFLARPKAFAAFLGYLIQQGMTPEEIGSTHLLHYYFSYHLSWLNRPDSPIKTLYDLLSSLSETSPLCEIAEKTCCDYRGFERYSLNGKMQAPDFASDPSAKIPRIDFPPRFSPAKNNLQSLYDIFENEFFMGALYQWIPQRDNSEWVSNITQLFNQPDTIATYLPPVINRLHELPELAEPLSQILTHQSLVVLMKNHVVGLLHLTPFCPSLINMIQASDLLAYIQTLQQQNTSGPALFSSLFSFFKAVKDSDSCSASILFDALLDAIHIDDGVLDDIIMLGKLRKFEHIETRVSKKIDMLEKQFEQTMQLSITSNGINYITISDVWRDTSIKVRHFKILDEKTETSIPMNEYLLRVNIARAFIELKGSARFDVENFSREMKIEPKFDLITITPYERLLVELLSRLDNEDIRINCIELLDTNVSHPSRSWRQSSYGNESFFRKAAISGNVGFIRWLYAIKFLANYLQIL